MYLLCRSDRSRLLAALEEVKVLRGFVCATRLVLILHKEARNFDTKGTQMTRGLCIA
jgi:hypothetical protein